MANYNTPAKPKLWIYAILFALSFLVMRWAVVNMHKAHNPGPVNSARAAERIKARRDLEVVAASELENGGDIDVARKIKRLPIQQAMDIIVRDWQNPEAGRSNLVARSLKAAEPAPVMQFE